FAPAACNSCSAKLRCSGLGLKSYLSSGKSSAMAISFRPISFQESSTTFSSGSAALGGPSFFAPSCECAGIANVAANKARARNISFFIGFLHGVNGGGHFTRRERDWKGEHSHSALRGVPTSRDFDETWGTDFLARSRYSGGVTKASSQPST